MKIIVLVVGILLVEMLSLLVSECILPRALVYIIIVLAIGTILIEFMI